MKKIPLTKQSVMRELKKIGQGVQFVSLIHQAKPTKKGEVGDLCRHTILVGASYDNLVQKSIDALTPMLDTMKGLQYDVAMELLLSLKNTIASRKMGMSNPAYTKPDQYVFLAPGLKLNKNDDTLEVFGISHKREVLLDGVHLPRESSARTIAKNKVRELLPVDKYRCYTLDLGNIFSIRINGTILEVE